MRKSLINLLIEFKKNRFYFIQEILNKKKITFTLLAFLLIIQALINLIGALGPELAFDALWYHLTFPKIYIENHKIFYTPGGLLYYSVMPKLTEMLYVVSLVLGDEILAKLIHYLFGLLTSIAIYKFSRKYCNKTFSLAAAVIFYSNLVVAWESITAYVDLTRAFFEILAFWAFTDWCEKGTKKWFIISAVMVGFAVTTKLLAVGSIVIFSILFIYYYVNIKKSINNLGITLLLYWFIALIIPTPWFIFSYLSTGNPIFPFFSSLYNVNLSLNLLNPLNIIQDVYSLFLKLADPISPVYLIITPLILIFFKRFNSTHRILVFYFFTSILIWYLTPRTGGGRFILPYLPAWSVLVALMVSVLKDSYIKRTLLVVVMLIAVTSIIYRGAANYKYLSVVLGLQTKEEFLMRNLNFSFGDFYDEGGEIKKILDKNDRVLLHNVHNLYYVDFPFIHESYLTKKDSFNHILVQNMKKPDKFEKWNLVYENDITKVKLYKQ